MKTRTYRRYGDRLLFAAGVLVALLVLGCETLDQDAEEGMESNIPWNQPQPWEAAPGIPGLSQ